MADRKKFSTQVTLKLRVNVAPPDGARKWRYLPPVYADKGKLGSKGKLKERYAKVGEDPKTKEWVTEYHEEGIYNLRWSDNGKPKWERVGGNANDAVAALIRRKSFLDARAKGNFISDQPADQAVPVPFLPVKDAPPEGRPIDQAVTDFLTAIGRQNVKVTVQNYSLAVTDFVEGCTKSTLEAVEESDILAYAYWLKHTLNLAPRTVSNRVKVVRTFLLHFKIPWPIERKNMPRFTKRVATAYDPADLVRLVKPATLDEREWVAFMVHTGVREKEAMHACGTDFAFGHRQFNVQEKKDFPNFKIKDSEERPVPIPDEFITMMKARIARYPHRRLLFPTEAGQPEGHMLRKLKGMAHRAGLNCGHCHSKDEYSGKTLCCDKHPVCRKWTLHDFRRTFATVRFATGKFTILEIKDQLGHEKIETTMAYLAAVKHISKEGWDALNSTFPGLTDF
jgi:integrase/recombinase XerD